MSTVKQTNPDQELTKLGLSEALIHEVLQAGELALRQTSKLAPRPAGGISRYNVHVEQLRTRMLRISGFEAACVNGLELVVNKSARMAFFFVQGDQDTGRPDATPESKRRCGSMTHLAKDSNLNQLKFHFARRSLSTPPIGPEGLVYWAIVYHRDFRAGEIRAEVSLPIGTDPKSGRINSWAPRLLLAPLKLLRPQKRRSSADSATTTKQQQPTFKRRVS